MSVALYANDTGYVMSDRYREIHYTDIKDADQKLLKYYKERIHNKISDFETYEDYFPYDMFKSLIMSDKRTLEYNFSYCNINERSSPDGKIKLYNWIFDVFVFGTDTRAVLTFSNGEFYGTYASIEENEGFHSLIVPIDTHKIETLQLADGSPLYLFFAGHRNLSSYITSVSAFVFNKDLLEPYNILNVDGKYVSEIDRCTVIGVSNVVRIEYRDGDLYIPQEGYQHHFFDGHICPTISGFNDVYHFDGEKFLYNKTIYDEDVALDST